MRDAKVVCRQLGYLDARRILRRSQVPSGSGQIWLAYVSCTGKEENISSCLHDGWGAHTCSHYRNAGVECTNTGIKTSYSLGFRIKVRLYPICCQYVCN